MTRNIARAVWLTASFLVIIFGVNGKAHGAANPTTERISVASDGSQANSFSGLSTPSHNVITPDGRYLLFESNATNLVPGNPTSGVQSDYIHDSQTGETKLVEKFARSGSISDDGKEVAYTGRDSNANTGIFVKHLDTGLVERVDQSTTGGLPDRGGSDAVISGNGRFVAFTSTASNLVSGDTNNIQDLFIRDLQTETTKRVSFSYDGSQANGFSINPTITPDGLYVAFTSAATNLVPNDTNNQTDIFLVNTQNNEIKVVSEDNNGNLGNYSSDGPSISADGRYVSFGSQSVLSDEFSGTSGQIHFYIRDTQTSTTKSVGRPGDGGISISANGRYALLLAKDDHLAPGVDASHIYIFMYDTLTNTYSVVSRTQDGSLPNGESKQAQANADGSIVLFSSQATNIVPGDTNGYDDIFMRNIGVSDSTPPTITASSSPQPNSNGWNNSDVTVSFNCTDDTAVASCSSPTILTSEGVNQTVTGTATDTAGNSSSATATVNIDKTAPTITYSVSTPPNSSGWNNSDTTVTFNCNDSLSGLATCSDPVTINAEGGSQTVTGTATDKAGNTSTVTASINLDKTAPTINYLVTPAPNINGWNQDNVNVTFNCSDSLSGIESCSGPEIVNAEGGNQSVTGTATDKAGNTSTVIATISLDKTAPSINYLVTPAPNINGWNQDNVTLSFMCDDSLSGIDSCTSPVTLSAEDGSQTVTGTAVDKAGNSSSVTATISLDKTAPTISSSVSPGANSNGWNNSEVTVSYTCDDTLSGVDTCSAPTTLSLDGANQSVTGTATDKAGNSSSTTATVNIDKTAPAITYSVSPSPNSDGWNNSDTTVAFNCSDSLSGIASCPSPVTLTEGAGQIITGTATDKAGNTASTSVMVNVDKTAPAVNSLNWSANPIQQGQNTTLMANVTDGLSSVKSVSYSLNGGTPQPMTYDPISGSWIVTFGSSLAVNTYNVVVTATDTADNNSTGKTDVLAVYTTSNGYVTGHAKMTPSASDTIPIALDTSNHTAQLVLGFTNVTAPTSGSFDMDYSIKNNQNEFSLSSTSISWVVVQDSNHASILGHGDMTKYVNGVKTVTQNMAVRFDITLGANGSPSHVSIKMFNPGDDPSSATPAYVISDDVDSNGSNLMIHP